MGQSPHHRHYDVAPSATHPEQAGDVSRRAILVGTVATTAAATLPLASSAYADAPDPGSKQDMMAFLLLSAALAGVHVTSLAPEFALDSSKDLLEQTPTIDPFNVKDDYFRFINAADEKSAFGKLLQIAKDHRQSAADIIAAVRQLALIANDDVIAGVLNRNGLVTGHGNRWTRERVTALRSHHRIPVLKPAACEAEPWLNLGDAARVLKVASKTLRLAAEAGVIEAAHPLPDGPWIFSRADLSSSAARAITDRARQNPRYPTGSHLDQQSLFPSET